LGKSNRQTEIQNPFEMIINPYPANVENMVSS